MHRNLRWRTVIDIALPEWWLGDDHQGSVGVDRGCRDDRAAPSSACRVGETPEFESDSRRHPGGARRGTESTVIKKQIALNIYLYIRFPATNQGLEEVHADMLGFVALDR